MKPIAWKLCLSAFAVSALATAAAVTTMSVQVREGPVRATPSFLGKVVASTAYGDAVNVMSQQGAWIEVTTGSGAKGWMHESALTRKKIVLRAGDEDAQTGASGDELALAGKGFNQQVENEFKQQNQEANFAWVDRMEEMDVSQREIQKFLREGQLTAAGE